MRTTDARGTFVPIAGHDAWWEVSTGGGTYIVNQETGECSCPAWEFRCSKRPGTLCKHGQSLSEHLDRLKECPACHGHGVLKLRCQYPGDDPLCAECLGTGEREPVSNPSDDQLRNLFR